MKNTKNRMITQVLAFDEAAFSMEKSEGSASMVSEIEVMRTGEWDHPSYGKMVITHETMDQMIANFNARLRKGVYFTEGHPVEDEELPAVGWVVELRKLGDSLKAVVEWTEIGANLLRTKAYKFFSPEFYFTYEDPETREKFENVLTGGALTNRPYFKSLEAVVLSERILSRKQKTMFKLDEVLAKDPSAISAEERAFLVSMKEDLDKSTVEKFKLDETQETDEEKAAREAKEKEEADAKAAEEAKKTEEEAAAAKKAEEEAAAAKAAEEAAAAEAAKGGETPEQKLEASEAKVKATETELEKTKRELSELKAEKRKKEFSEKISAFKFSEETKKGLILPKSIDKVQAFAESLNEEQAGKFFEILGELPQKGIFKEIGATGDGEGAGVNGVDMSKKPANVDEMSFAIAETAKQIAASEKKADGSAYSLQEATIEADKRLSQK